MQLAERKEVQKGWQEQNVFMWQATFTEAEANLNGLEMRHR